MTRRLAIGSLEAAKGDPLEEVPWEQAHALVRDLRREPEPWQRQDETLRRYDDLRGIRTPTGASVFRSSEQGATPMQFAGDEAAAHAILSSLRTIGSVSLFNWPEGDTLAATADALGAHTALRQKEMVRFLQ